MIVDCYTHIWDSAGKVGLKFDAARNLPPLPREAGTELLAGPGRHLAASKPVDRSIVVGFKSHYLGVDIPNDYIAAQVAGRPDRLIGFAGVDPSRPREAIDEMKRARDELGLRGVAVAPAAQDFHPTNSQAMRVYAAAAELGLPMLFHTGVQITPATKLSYAEPVLLDEIARELPALRMIIAHMGYPWVSETNVLLAKHANVYSEISWLLHQPWQAYQALLSAYHYGVIDKLLFGSGFPYLSASYSIEVLYSINHMVHGTHLPTVPREALRGIVERDALGLLGIGTAAGSPAAPPHDAPEPDFES